MEQTDLISELKLLQTEDESYDFIIDRLPPCDADALCAWAGTDLKEALKLYLWCCGEGESVFSTGDEADVFFKKASAQNISSDRLYSLFESHKSLQYTEAKTEVNHSGRGLFIVLEGIDGAGKTTHLARLTKKLTESGRRVYSTAEPTQGAVGGLIRDTLSGYTQRPATELAALFLADRIHHNENPINGIRKMLAEGYDVICDRYYYSSLAYQGVSTDLDWLMNCNLGCPAVMKPDICIFLDLPASVSANRIASTRATKEIFETEDMIRRIKHRFADVFRLLNSEENIKIVNTDKPADSVGEEIYGLVSEIL